MRFLKTFISFFSTITVGILIVCAVNICLSPHYVIPRSILFDILLAGFVTAAVTTAIYSREITSHKQFLLTSAVHYVLLCIIMIGFGVWFGWMDLDIGGVVMMMVSVAVVYALTFLMNYILAKKEADEINKALEQRNK